MEDFETFGDTFDKLAEQTDEVYRSFRRLSEKFAALNPMVPSVFSEEEKESTVEKLKEIVVFLDSLGE